MSDLQKRMRNVSIMAGRKQTPAPRSTPSASPYTGRQRQYFAPATDAHTWDAARYASNYYAAQVQGCIPGDFSATRGAYLRTMDLIDHSTGAELPNDWQVVYFQDSKIQGLYTGAKLEYAGNTWLCTAPRSVAESSGNATIRRCTAAWRYLDYYGNIKAEPFIWSKGPQSGTSNHAASNNTLADALPQKCAIQLNEQTEQLRHNTRMILGRNAYQLTGIVDFMQDFPQEPPHIMFFDLELTEPNPAIDDMERGIAGGLSFNWSIRASGPNEVQQGERVNLGIFSERSDGINDNVVVENTPEHPITYVFTSCDYSILDVDQEGNISGIAEGAATITVSLFQNPEIRADFPITVTAQAAPPAIIIDPETPASMRMQSTYTATVYYTENGKATADPVTVTASGADSYAYTVTMDDQTLTVKCWQGTSTPLTLTLKCKGLTETRKITLRGF